MQIGSNPPLNIFLDGGQANAPPLVGSPRRSIPERLLAQYPMTTDHTDDNTVYGIEDWSYGCLTFASRATKRKTMANPDFGSPGHAGDERITNGLGVAALHAFGDIKVANFPGRNTKARLEGRIDRLISEAPIMQSMYREEKVRSVVPVETAARQLKRHPLRNAGSLRLAGIKTEYFHETHSLFGRTFKFKTEPSENVSPSPPTRHPSISNYMTFNSGNYIPLSTYTPLGSIFLATESRMSEMDFDISICKLCQPCLRHSAARSKAIQYCLK